MGVPLTVRGRRQAREAADLLVRAGMRRPVRLFSSDQARAAETAAIIAARVAVPVAFTPELREQSLGSLEGRLARGLSAQPIPEGAHVSEIAWGGGETIEQVWVRIASFTQTHLLPCPDDDVILVTHGTLLQVFLSYLEGRSHRDVDWDVLPRNGQVIIRALPAFPVPRP